MRAIVIKPGASPAPDLALRQHGDPPGSRGRRAGGGRYKSYVVMSSADPHASPNRTLDGRTFCGPIIITAAGGLGLAEALELRDDCATWPRAVWGVANG